MCGIAGIHLREGHVSLARLRRMSEILQHRGPDDEGIVLLDPARRGHLTLAGIDTPQDVLASNLPFSPGKSAGNPVDAIYRVGLVHRRLSILDLSPTGHGPMSDRDAKLWITFNSEIYNFVELKQELKQLGHGFIGTSDTEVILAAYRQWGKACLQRFNGMFAFALWDADRRELFCARDRLGVKPFYYQWRANEFAFASEPKALVLTQEAPIRARLEAVRDLVALDWVDHRQGTFFEGVEQLPPGHSISIGPEGVRLERWWGLDPSRRATGNPVEWEHEFERLFTDSVRLRLLRADVEVGSCLSGGLDSSAVVTTAAMQLEKPVHTFTCAYDEGPAFDERSYVKLVAEKSGAISQTIVPTGDDFWEVFDHIAASQDEPTAGPGLYSQWKVMELAKSAKLKVLLDGQGGDETLAGYWRYLPMRLRDLLAAGDFGGFTKLWPHVADRLGVQTTLGLVLEPWLPAAIIDPLRRRFGQGKDRVLGPALRKLPPMPRPIATNAFPTALSRQLAFDTTERLLPSLLRYEDRNSMAFGIETRLPFLDYRLVEHVFALPDEQKLDGTTSKSILRRALANRVPRPILDRRDKMGFETPTDLWLRGRHAGEVRRRLTLQGPLHEWIELSSLTDELDEYLAGRRPIGYQVWRWLALDAWARRYLTGDARAMPRAPRVPSSPIHRRLRTRWVRPAA